MHPIAVAVAAAAGFVLAAADDFRRAPGDDHMRPIFAQALQGRTDDDAPKFVGPR